MRKGQLKAGLAATGALAVFAAGGAAIAGATGGGDEAADQPVTGSALDRASAVALQRTGGGKVTGSEIRDEEGYYEIEVTRDDGNQVDVHLDRSFHVMDSQADGAAARDRGPRD